ncbi:hypothetical protein B0H13DRAFT_2392542 [Mycena leptocephala]|nr:hypothetical protein B0H13DRAFT_2392542 [Mycena leptocephala]
MRFTVSLLAAVVLAIQANAQQIIAFSGDTCNGAKAARFLATALVLISLGGTPTSSTASVSLFSGQRLHWTGVPFGPDPAASASMSTQGPASVRSVAPGPER